MRAFAAFVAVGLVASAVADDDKPHDVQWRSVWKVGQVVTVTKHDTMDTDTTMNGRPLKSDHEGFDATYVKRCDEVDASGGAVKLTVFFKEWKQTKGGRTDDSLTGATVHVDGKKWTLDPGKTPGLLAAKWLDHNFAGKDDDPLKLLTPPKLVVGKTWKPDPKDAAKAFAASVGDAPIDPTRVEVEITLESVDGAPPHESGTMRMKMHAPFDPGFKALPPGATLGADSGFEAIGVRTGPLTGDTMLESAHTDLAMTMTMETSLQGRPVTVSAKGKGAEDEKTVAGGEIPAPAKPDGK